ncbi:NUDIX domain-containing protein [Aureibaculum sp. 2210JD6-5]|uniref:NUDIX hydrolase n=1 Tax=Aureibaculum sp. 2210JD6-5 TaxID=3103957 RepID=UPI002AADB07B|nr:NUDIX domain-containing protein [Aureibaculum sp. 2210JD6-5]MDY7396924.1 NUDIX domain-containing protein [Aureibaculum sp. 2210JD6-5]
MKSVFFNNQPIYLVTDLKFESDKHFHHINEVDLISLLKKNEEGFTDTIYLYNENADFLWQSFSNQFKIIEAAGGKVFSENNKILFIYRNDKWDLPKGKIEKGESAKEGAIREVEEETGIENLTIKEPLETTYHIYKHKEKYVLKISYWFKMTSDFKGKLLPQEEEGITKVEWFAESEIVKALENTYANIKLLF